MEGRLDGESMLPIPHPFGASCDPSSPYQGVEPQQKGPQADQENAERLPSGWERGSLIMKNLADTLKSV